MFTPQALGLGILILGLSEVSIPQDRNQAGHSLFFVPHCRLSSRTFGPSSLVSSWLFIGKHLFLLKGEMPAQSLNKAQQDILTGLLLDDRNPSRVAQAKMWGRMGEGLGSCYYYSWKDPDRSGKLRIGNSCGCSGTGFSLPCPCACFPQWLPPSSFLLLLSLSCPVSLSCLVSVTVWRPLITSCLSRSFPFLLSALTWLSFHLHPPNWQLLSSELVSGS